jgi:hypothetical protein
VTTRTAIEQQPAPADSQPLLQLLQQPHPGRDGTGRDGTGREGLIDFYSRQFPILTADFHPRQGVATARELPRVKRAGRADTRSTGFSPWAPPRTSLAWVSPDAVSDGDLKLQFPCIFVRQVLCGPYYVLTLFNWTPVPIWVLIWVVCGKASC